MRGESGSVVVGVALVSTLLVFMVGLAVVGAVAASFATAATAADAAALASAPVTFRPFGAKGTATQEAERFASANGATLVACLCATDLSWNERTVSVTVSRDVLLPVLGRMSIRATSRATFDPSALLADPSALLADPSALLADPSALLADP